MKVDGCTPFCGITLPVIPLLLLPVGLTGQESEELPPLGSTKKSLMHFMRNLLNLFFKNLSEFLDIIKCGHDIERSSCWSKKSEKVNVSNFYLFVGDEAFSGASDFIMDLFGTDK